MQRQKFSWAIPPWLPPLRIITFLPELSRLEEADQAGTSNQTTHSKLTRNQNRPVIIHFVSPPNVSIEGPVPASPWIPIEALGNAGLEHEMLSSAQVAKNQTPQPKEDLVRRGLRVNCAFGCPRGFRSRLRRSLLRVPTIVGLGLTLTAKIDPDYTANKDSGSVRDLLNRTP